MNNEHLHNYPMGTTFVYPTKARCVHTIVDTLKTYNGAGELVGFSYVTEHVFMGVKHTMKNVSPLTVARALEA